MASPRLIRSQTFAHIEMSSWRIMNRRGMERGIMTRLLWTDGRGLMQMAVLNDHMVMATSLSRRNGEHMQKATLKRPNMKRLETAWKWSELRSV